MFYGPDFITVTKVSSTCPRTACLLNFVHMKSLRRINTCLFSYQADEDVEWTDIKRHALEAIANFYESGDPITTGVVHHESSECTMSG